MSKIYKYGSIESAIAILKSGGVLMKNPDEYNDPYEGDYVQDENDLKKCKKLLDHFIVLKAFIEFVDNKNIIYSLQGIDKAKIESLNKQIKLTLKFIEKYPYYTGTPGFSFLTKLLNKIPDFKSLYESTHNKYSNLLNKTTEALRTITIVACFSERNDSILMWSHYAKSHTGACIEYDQPNNEFIKVKYRKKRAKLKLFRLVSKVFAYELIGKDNISFTKKDYKGIVDPIYIKSKEWSYEKEKRYINTHKNSNENMTFDITGNVLRKMPNPTAIYIGCKANKDEQLSELMLMADRRNIPVYFMKKSDDYYSVVIDNNDNSFIPKPKEYQKEITLLRIIKEIKDCLNRQNYLSAFSMSLIIPSICSQVVFKDIIDEKEKYIRWCDLALNTQTDNEINKIDGQTVWILKEQLFSKGNIGNAVLHTENNKNLFFTITINSNHLTVNVNSFIKDIIEYADNNYKDYKKEIGKLKQINIFDIDQEISDMQEDSISGKNLNDFFN